MKLYLEIPDNWIDVESPILYASSSIGRQALQSFKEAAVEQIISKQEMPTLVISPEELKAAVLDRMAERAIEELKKSV